MRVGAQESHFQRIWIFRIAHMAGHIPAGHHYQADHQAGAQHVEARQAGNELLQDRRDHQQREVAVHDRRHGTEQFEDRLDGFAQAMPREFGQVDGNRRAERKGARLMANALLNGITTTMQVSIDIKPGSTVNPIRLSSLGTIPVAILSTADIDAPAEVDRTSLTFGRTGDEQSLASCSTLVQDVNWDGLPDLVCRFKTRLTQFKIGDTVGVLKGQTLDGAPIEGSDAVRILR